MEFLGQDSHPTCFFNLRRCWGSSCNVNGKGTAVAILLGAKRTGRLLASEQRPGSGVRSRPDFPARPWFCDLTHRQSSGEIEPRTACAKCNGTRRFTFGPALALQFQAILCDAEFARVPAERKNVLRRNLKAQKST